MNRFCKLICLGAAVMVSSGGFADSSDVSQSNQKTQRMSNGKRAQNAPAFEQGMGLPANKYPAAYNAPAGISLRNSWDFDIFASFIYWHASQDLMDIAYVPTVATPSAATTVSGTVAFQDVNYKPGFKVGFGFNTDHDGWMFRAEYTWLHQTVSTSSITAPLLPTGLPGSWTQNNWFTTSNLVNSGAAVSSSWNLKIDMVDAVMQRPFYQGTMLTVTPYGGMRALWLRQKMNVNLLTGAGSTVAFSNNRSNSWSIGPTTGVGGHWILGAGFRFEGNAAASLLYTRYTKIAHNEQDGPFFQDLAVLGVGSSTKNMNTLRPVGQLAVGLGWGTYCCDTEFYFDISLDYEFLYLWDQNVMREWTGMLRGVPSVSGDLQIHGLTATFRFDF